MLIDLATAKMHVSADDDAGDALLTIYIGAAERFASEYLQRNIYTDQDALTAAMAAAPGIFAAAATAFDTAIDAANAMTEGPAQDMAWFAANDLLAHASQVSRMTHQGIVINDQIKAAMLLTIGHLYANREDTVLGHIVFSLPMGSQYLMDPFRAY